MGLDKHTWSDDGKCGGSSRPQTRHPRWKSRAGTIWHPWRHHAWHARSHTWQHTWHHARRSWESCTLHRSESGPVEKTLLLDSGHAAHLVPYPDTALGDVPGS